MFTYLAPDHRGLIVLKNKPPHDSPYAKYDRIISRLEALDSLLCFAYGQFYSDFTTNSNNLNWWMNSVPYFDNLTKRHMDGFPDPGPAEHALHGIQYVSFCLPGCHRAQFD